MINRRTLKLLNCITGISKQSGNLKKIEIVSQVYCATTNNIRFRFDIAEYISKILIPVHFTYIKIYKYCQTFSPFSE